MALPAHDLPAPCSSRLGAPLGPQCPFPAARGKQSPSASLGSGGLGAEQSSTGEPEGLPEGCSVQGWLWQRERLAGKPTLGQGM